MNYRIITSKRQFKDATGYSREEFDLLLSDYEETYYESKGQSYEEYIEENVMERPKLSTLGDCLFFTLFQLKNDMIWGSLGCAFGMAGSTAHDNFEYFSKILETTLDKKKYYQSENLKMRRILKRK